MTERQKRLEEIKKSSGAVGMIKAETRLGKIVLEKRENGDILPLNECPYCRGELETVDKQFCSSTEIFKECESCKRIFKETWVIESIIEIKEELE